MEATAASSSAGGQQTNIAAEEATFAAAFAAAEAAAASSSAGGNRTKIAAEEATSAAASAAAEAAAASSAGVQRPSVVADEATSAVARADLLPLNSAISPKLSISIPKHGPLLKQQPRSISLPSLFSLLMFAVATLAVYALGPTFVFGFFGVVDLPDQLPACDGSQYIFQCECGPGQEADGASWWKLVTKNHCDACDEHEFKPARGNYPCAACAPFEVGAGNGTACDLCPAGTTRRFTPSGSAGSVCAPCPANTYFSDLDGCPACPRDSWSKEGSGRCAACALGTYRGASDAACKMCPQNSFKDPAVRGACSACAVDTFSPRGSLACSACPRGHFRGASDLACKMCPQNLFKDPAVHGACSACDVDTFSSQGAVTCSACPRGYFRGASDEECSPCPRNTYKPDPALDSSRKPGGCEKCGNLEFTEGAGLVGRAACVCVVGTTRHYHADGDASLDCARCPDKTYKNSTGDRPCTPIDACMQAVEPTRHAQTFLGKDCHAQSLVSSGQGFFNLPSLKALDVFLVRTGLAVDEVVFTLKESFRTLLDTLMNRLFADEPVRKDEEPPPRSDPWQKSHEAKACPFESEEAVLQSAKVIFVLKSC